MSGIFGIVRRDGSPLDVEQLEVLRTETAHWGRDGGGVSHDGVAGIGLALRLPGHGHAVKRLPLTGEDGCIFSAAGRLDNRDELAGALGIGIAEIATLGDGSLMHRAWLRWGQGCPARIFGDWAFATWNPRERTLFLARDHSGTTALYYHTNPNFFAFSSSRRALLKLNLPAVELDELYLAQVLISWFGYHGERTIHSQIRRVPPGYQLTVAPDRVQTSQYFHLENTPEIQLPRKDYVPAFREVFDRAVLARMRGEGMIGATLSGGLDSGSVVSTGAAFLKHQGQRLSAFTSVPRFETAAYTGLQFGDELPYARATAEMSENVDLVQVAAEGVCPIDAIREALRISMEPKHGAGNMFWLMELRRIAAKQGCQTLLTGSNGNQSISWSGHMVSQPVRVQILGLGWRRWLKAAIRRQTPQKIVHSRREYKIRQYGWRNSAIHPDFAARLDLSNQYLDSLDHYEKHAAQSPLFHRCSMGIDPGPSFQGASQAEMGAASGLEIRDPTADARLLAFCFSVPDRIFVDPQTGVDRWLIREAMKGRLPESVRMNRRVGLQAADLVPRLRNSATAVERALAEIEGGPAARYVSIPIMRKAWGQILTEDTPQAFLLAVAVLSRGIMAGLFVNGFGTEW